MNCLTTQETFTKYGQMCILDRLQKYLVNEYAMITYKELTFNNYDSR